MINTIQLIRNIGQFNSVDAGAQIALARITLVYAENGRGKTTLAAILRSLATGDPIPIAERRRLAAQHPPHVVLNCAGGTAVFQNNAWNGTVANIAVFDDVFVDRNVYSGLAIESGHRQNLHELILGAQAVAMNQRLQQLVGQIDEHNAKLRERAAAIPVPARAGLSVDEFCALAARPDIDTLIDRANRTLAAAQQREPVRRTPLFEPLALPAFEPAAIDQLLTEDLPSLNSDSAARVQAHLNRLGRGGEAWVGEGMRFAANATSCPFCAQTLVASHVVALYGEYFGSAYAGLKRRVSEAAGGVNLTHGNDIPAAFERAVRIGVERRQFWSQFCNVPEIAIDTAAIVRDWRAAREAITAALAQKQAAPLERMRLPDAALAAVRSYEAHREMIGTLSADLQRANSTIQVTKEQAAAGDPAAISADLSRLNAVKARHTTTIAQLCDAYLAEKAAKTNTEQNRDYARAQLDQLRATAFADYQTAVNIYLQRFNAGFRLQNVAPAQTRGGPTCTYSVVINNIPVAVGTAQAGEPSFRNTLSSGDRNTLALAFFFASLDRDPQLADKIVVIDDPISSLDDHRSLTTVQELRRLAERVGQVIVLSHSKQFLCRVWESSDSTARASLCVKRDGAGSTLEGWNVEEDCITEHDRRHAMLRDYLDGNTATGREVARAIRPHLEAFLRVAFPQHFVPGTLLGPFVNLCRQRVGTHNEILGGADLQELEDLKEFANRFHHDTNRAWETATVNDGELEGFARRTLEFAKR